MRSVLALFGIAALWAGSASAHGHITSHDIRRPGAKSAELCGKDYNQFYLGEDNGNDIWGPLRDTNPYNYHPWKTKDCQWNLCRGAEFEDNKEHVYQFKKDEPIHLQIFILAAHPGTANISIVDTKTNTVVPGGQLKFWPKDFARWNYWGSKGDGKGDKNPSDQVDFVVDMVNLAGKCQTPGECVIQFWWWGRDSAADQYYESCIDFIQPVEYDVIQEEEEAQKTFTLPAHPHQHA